MFTYFLYNVILIVSCSFAYFAEYGNTKIFRSLSRFIVFVALWLPAALRYDTGKDYLNYVAIFDETSFLYVEPAWEALNNIVHYLGLSVQWIFVISSFLIYFPICFVLKRKNYSFAILFFILYQFYFSSFNIVRQFVAVSFVICALVCFLDKKFIPFLLFVILGILFHTSSLIIVPLLIFNFIKYKSRTIPVIITLFGIIIITRIDILSIIFSILTKFGSRYARFASSEFYIVSGIKTGIATNIRLLPLLVAIYMAPRIIKNDRRDIFFINLSIIYVFLTVLTFKYRIFDRLVDFLYFVPLFIGGSAIRSMGKYKKIIAVLLVLLNLACFENYIQYQTRDKTSQRMYPYLSIFSNGVL